MHVVDTRHGPLAYLRQGSGAPLLLLHGNTMTAESQTRLAQRFADEHTVISIDLLGHGHSARPPKLFSTHYFAMQSEAIADLLRTCAFSQRAALFGMSAGALTALNAAAIAPEQISALILDGIVRTITPTIVATNHTSLAQLSPEWIKYMETQHGADWWPHLRAGIITTVEQLAADHTDLIPNLEHIHHPALIFQGGNDHFCPENQGRQIAAKLPHARLIYDADAGHLLAWKNPTAFRETVRTFLVQHTHPNDHTHANRRSIGTTSS